MLSSIGAGETSEQRLEQGGKVLIDAKRQVYRRVELVSTQLPPKPVAQQICELMKEITFIKKKQQETTAFLFG